MSQHPKANTEVEYLGLLDSGLNNESLRMDPLPPLTKFKPKGDKIEKKSDQNLKNPNEFDYGIGVLHLSHFFSYSFKPEYKG